MIQLPLIMKINVLIGHFQIKTNYNTHIQVNDKKLPALGW
jgi:hypothetical protein